MIFMASAMWRHSLASSASPRPSQACACSAAFAIAAKPCCSSICRAGVWTWTSDIMGALPFDDAARLASRGLLDNDRAARPVPIAHIRQGSPPMPRRTAFSPTPSWSLRSDPLPDRSAFALEIVGHFDIDLQGRHLVAALEPDDDLGRVKRDMPGHDGENFLAQHAEQIGLAAQSAFMGKQDLQPFACDRCGGLVATEKPEQTHAHAA